MAYASVSVLSLGRANFTRLAIVSHFCHLSPTFVSVVWVLRFLLAFPPPLLFLTFFPFCTYGLMPGNTSRRLIFVLLFGVSAGALAVIYRAYFGTVAMYAFFPISL